MGTVYVLMPDSKVYKTEDLCATPPAWEVVTDPEEQKIITEARVMNLEEIYPVWRAAREAWEAD